MSEKPIYLTTKRLLYNIARVDFDYGRITQEELDRRKKTWEIEYNDKTIQAMLEKKYQK